MIEFRNDDLFQSECEALINPVNCVGVMGGGLAKIFKNKYPDMYKDYRQYCKEGKLRPGGLHIYVDVDESPEYIINFPTKDNWLEDSKIEYVIDGLKSLKRIIKDLNIKSIGIPAIGSGLGNLNYEDVKPLLEQFAIDLPDVKVVCYEPK